MIIFNDIADEVRDIPIDFPFPDLSNPLYISRKTIVDNGQIIGAGLVRLTAEGILILDKSKPLFSRTVGAKRVIEELKKDVKQKGLDECHVFVRDPNVQLFLQRLGFVQCRGGTPLVIHF